MAFIGNEEDEGGSVSEDRKTRLTPVFFLALASLAGLKKSVFPFGLGTSAGRDLLPLIDGLGVSTRSCTTGLGDLDGLGCL